MMLFNRHIRALFLHACRESININYDDEYYEALKSRQETYTRKLKLTKTLHYFLQDLQYRSRWRMGVHGCMAWPLKETAKSHWVWTYQVWLMKMGRVITWNTKHIRHTPVTVEQYLWDQLAKARKQTPVGSWGTNTTHYHNKSYG